MTTHWLHNRCIFTCLSLSCRFALSEITSLNEMMKTYLKDWQSSINMACKGSIFIYIFKFKIKSVLSKHGFCAVPLDF